MKRDFEGMLPGDAGDDLATSDSAVERDEANGVTYVRVPEVLRNGTNGEVH